MNMERRKYITKIIEQMKTLANGVQELVNEEQESLANLPEFMQKGLKGEKMLEAIDALENAYNSFYKITSYLEEARV